MALRIRKDGRIMCAAICPPMLGDTYINDGLHYEMSVEHKVIGTDDNHMKHGEWWWTGNVPEGIILNDFYSTKEKLPRKMPRYLKKQATKVAKRWKHFGFKTKKSSFDTKQG